MSKKISRLGLVLSWALLAGPLSFSAHSATEAPESGVTPALPVAAFEPLPEALRRPIPESVDDLRALEKRVQELVPQLQATTVGVRVGAAQGSGVIVSEDGYVLTAGHVSGTPGRRVTLIMPDGSTHRGVTLGRERDLDVGLIKINSEGTWPVAKVGDVKSLEVGDWVIGIGHPGGFDGERSPVVRLGRITLKLSAIWQTECPLVGGDSGGPLFDLNGRVVGIHSRIGPDTTFNFHVPISQYTGNWEWLLRGEDRPTVKRTGGPLLGVDGEDSRGGCRITRVAEGSPAAESGIQINDIITHLQGERIRGIDDLVAAVNRHDAGDEIRLTLRRDGQEETILLTLAARGQ